LQKNQSMEGEVFFLRYVNNIRFEIDESDLIYASYASDIFPIY
jgi:hypothetical protein